MESLTIKEFMNRKDERLTAKLERHFKKYKLVYKVAGMTTVLLTMGGFDYSVAASTGIDIGAKKLYYEIVNIGKWIIIFKGGVDTIKSVGNGDFEAAKKTFFSHLLIYLMLLGLPYGMDKVDEVFRSITKA